MRKATLFWLGMATVCGTLLFHTSQEVTDGRSALRRMERDVLREEESLRVLQAEWSYLNQPERLEKLAREHLNLVPLNGRQFIRVSDLNERIDESALAAAQENEIAEETPAVAVTSAPVPVIAPVIPPAAIEPAAGEKPARRVADAPPAPPKIPASVSAKQRAMPAPAAKPVATKPAPAPVPTPVAATPARAFDDVLKNLGVE